MSIDMLSYQTTCESMRTMIRTMMVKQYTKQSLVIGYLKVADYLTIDFFKIGHPWPLMVYFWYFQTKNTNFTTK